MINEQGRCAMRLDKTDEALLDEIETEAKKEGQKFGSERSAWPAAKINHRLNLLQSILDRPKSKMVGNYQEKSDRARVEAAIKILNEIKILRDAEQRRHKEAALYRTMREQLGQPKQHDDVDFLSGAGPAAHSEALPKQPASSKGTVQKPEKQEKEDAFAFFNQGLVEERKKADEGHKKGKFELLREREAQKAQSVASKNATDEARKVALLSASKELGKKLAEKEAGLQEGDWEPYRGAEIPTSNTASTPKQSVAPSSQAASSISTGTPEERAIIEKLLTANYTRNEYRKAASAGIGGGPGREKSNTSREKRFTEIERIKKRLRDNNVLPPKEKAVVLHEILTKMLATTGGRFNISSQSAFGSAIKSELNAIEKVFTEKVTSKSSKGVTPRKEEVEFINKTIEQSKLNTISADDQRKLDAAERTLLSIRDQVTGALLTLSTSKNLSRIQSWEKEKDKLMLQNITNYKVIENAEKYLKEIFGPLPTSESGMRKQGGNVVKVLDDIAKAKEDIKRNGSRLKELETHLKPGQSTRQAAQNTLHKAQQEVTKQLEQTKKILEASRINPAKHAGYNALLIIQTQINDNIARAEKLTKPEATVKESVPPKKPVQAKSKTLQFEIDAEKKKVEGEKSIKKITPLTPPKSSSGSVVGRAARRAEVVAADLSQRNKKRNEAVQKDFIIIVEAAQKISDSRLIRMVDEATKIMDQIGKDKEPLNDAHKLTIVEEFLKQSKIIIEESVQKVAQPKEQVTTPSAGSKKPAVSTLPAYKQGKGLPENLRGKVPRHILEAAERRKKEETSKQGIMFSDAATSRREEKKEPAKESSSIVKLLSVNTKDKYQEEVGKGVGFARQRGAEGSEKGKDREIRLKEIEQVKVRLKGISNMAPEEKAQILYKTLNEQYKKTGWGSALGAVLKNEMAALKKEFPNAEQTVEQKGKRRI